MHAQAMEVLNERGAALSQASDPHCSLAMCDPLRLLHPPLDPRHGAGAPSREVRAPGQALTGLLPWDMILRARLEITSRS